MGRCHLKYHIKNMLQNYETYPQKLPKKWHTNHNTIFLTATHSVSRWAAEPKSPWFEPPSHELGQQKHAG